MKRGVLLVAPWCVICPSMGVAKPVSPPVVTITHPNNEAYGDWSFSPVGKLGFGTTDNDAGNRFGVICDRDCLIFVNLKRECENGSTIPVMVNTKGGAITKTFQCEKLEEAYALTSDLTDDMKSVMENGGEIGFAIPLASGLFAVSRFSLTGSIPAIRRAAQYGSGRTSAAPEAKSSYTM